MLNSPEDIERLKVPSLRAGRVPEYIKANLLAARSITDRPVLGGCIGPFSLAGRLYDMSEIMILIYQNPEAAHTLLAKMYGIHTPLLQGTEGNRCQRCGDGRTCRRTHV